MTADPAELERQHLADLLEAMRRCAFFSHRLAQSIPWPLTANFLDSHCSDLELSDKLAAFNERFSKLQDSAAVAMRHAALLSGEKATTFLEVLGFFEKIGVVKSMRDWQRIRTLRNMAAHDYSIHFHDIALHFNALHEVLPDLIGVAVRLINYCTTKLFISPANVIFAEDWESVVKHYSEKT
jgi:hypothetical protein